MKQREIERLRDIKTETDRRRDGETERQLVPIFGESEKQRDRETERRSENMQANTQKTTSVFSASKLQPTSILNHETQNYEFVFCSIFLFFDCFG